jgi:nicotinamide-nucleotide amidase
MIVELINTGSELMLGRVLNTHQQWLCRQLADLGYTVSRQIAVADAGPHIQQAVRESLARADLIITTGGLGPTSDDLTRDLISQLLGQPLRENPEVLAHIETFFTARKRPMPASTRVQALVPKDATVLMNNHGTAPGLAIQFRTASKPGWLIMLPGPPRELRPMFTQQVAPLLHRQMPLDAPFFCRTLRTTGLGESLIEERVGAKLKPFVNAGGELGYCARISQVDVRLCARGADATTLLDDAESIVRSELGGFIYGSGDEELEQTVVRLLTERKLTLALAESCTGGSIANRITNVPGASAVFPGGFVTYANTFKTDAVGVPAELIQTHGAVSEPVAREMARGAQQRAGADFAIAVTGIAGPDGGTDAKPVGTVFIALAYSSGIQVEHRVNPYDRETFKHATGNQALEMLRQTIQKL